MLPLLDGDIDGKSSHSPRVHIVQISCRIYKHCVNIIVTLFICIIMLCTIHEYYKDMDSPQLIH